MQNDYLLVALTGTSDPSNRIWQLRLWWSVLIKETAWLQIFYQRSEGFDTVLMPQVRP